MRRENRRFFVGSVALAATAGAVFFALVQALGAYRVNTSERMEIFIKGLAMGFCIAAPVGPIGLLCIRRSIVDGRTRGFVSGLGAATADALYGLIAALSLTAVTAFLLHHRTPIQAFGGFFLIYLGLKLIRARPPAAAPGPIHAKSLWSAFASTLALTLANPATIVAFIGIFAGLGLQFTDNRSESAAMLVSGVFLGSAAWWLMLSCGSHWLGNRVGAHRLHVINTISGSLIVAFGAWQLLSLLR